METHILSFEELSNRQLYEIIKLRFDVFVVEQDSIYEEHDRIDYKSMHMFTWSSEERVDAYLRMFKMNDELASIGRIAVHPDKRGIQLGRQFVADAIAYIESNWKCDIEIGAQTYLKRFYEGFGFVQSSEPYDDGGILHITMIRKFKA